MKKISPMIGLAMIILTAGWGGACEQSSAPASPATKSQIAIQPNQSAIQWPDTVRLSLGQENGMDLFVEHAADSIRLCAVQAGKEFKGNWAPAPGFKFWDLRPLLLPFDGRDCQMLRAKERYWMLPFAPCRYVVAFLAYGNKHSGHIYLLEDACDPEAMRLSLLSTREVGQLPFDTLRAHLYHFDDRLDIEAEIFDLVRYKIPSMQGRLLKTIRSDKHDFELVRDSASYMEAMILACRLWRGR